MNKKKIVIYFVVPFFVTLALVGMYFSGVDALQNLITPHLEDFDADQRREFGALENIQNLVLLGMVCLALYAMRGKKSSLEKWGLAGIALFTAFIFLEEIDYGLHYYELIMNIEKDQSTDARNWHNVGDRTSRTKQIVDISMVVWFGVMPFALFRVKNPVMRFLTPDRYSVLTLAAALLIRTIAHYLQDKGLGEGGGIQKNTSEFRELITYYLFGLYLYELGLKRSLGDYVQLASELPGEMDD